MNLPRTRQNRLADLRHQSVHASRGNEAANLTTQGRTMTTTKTAKKPTTPKASTTRTTRRNRTAEERVAALEAEIARVRAREATKELRADPAVKATSAAVRAVNKALGIADEPALADALTAAHAALAGFLEARGLCVPQPGKRRDRAA